MNQNKISILSTRPVDPAIISEAAQLNLAIEVLPFIETRPVQSEELQSSIIPLFSERTTVIFTSMNAVEAVAGIMGDQKPDWKIYGVGDTTRRLVKKYFGKEAIAEFSNSSADLAKLVIEKGETGPILFFCGDRRRDELPNLLGEQGIPLWEIIVYHTIDLHHTLEKDYQGILFFSPSAVKSFFSDNRPARQTIFFAIGNTTASAIKKYADNPVIVAEEPGMKNLVNLMIGYFNQENKMPGTKKDKL